MSITPLTTPETASSPIVGLDSAASSWALMAALVEHVRDGVVVVDSSWRVLHANRRAQALRPMADGHAPEAWRVVNILDLRHDDAWTGLVDEPEWPLLQLTIRPLPAHPPLPRCFAITVAEPTLVSHRDGRPDRRAHIDALTGLPNRNRLPQLLREAITTADRDGSLLAVCVLDADHLKRVNAEHGRAVGDRLLEKLAERLHGMSTPGSPALAARMDGDEFAFLVRSATPEEARHAIQRLTQAMAQPYVLDTPNGALTLALSVTVGATLYPLDSAGPGTLMRHASHALYGAKQAGRAGFAFFDAERDRRAEARYYAIGRVQGGFDDDQFALHYQPKVDLINHRVVGVEALLRWEHPEHGVTAPGDFLPIIEHTGLGDAVGDWVLRQGIAQIDAWRRAGLAIDVSVNVSARHLQQAHFARRLAELLAPYDPSLGSHLIIEILETAALADLEHTGALMRVCRDLGVRFALDDFGTGYANLAYLKRLPLDMLKIDRSFVADMLDDPHDLAIVESVIGFSRTFNCQVVAEGVASPAIAERLIAMGCTVGQGHGIAAAMPADQVQPWVQHWLNEHA